MNRNYFFIPGLVNEKVLLEDAMEKTIEGDYCIVHYHTNGQTCNTKCHTVELPKESEGEVL